MSRTKRKAMTGSKAIDGSCRNHGTCPYCTKGRQHKHKRRAPAEEGRVRLEGIEPSHPVWETGRLPLHYRRKPSSQP